MGLTPSIDAAAVTGTAVSVVAAPAACNCELICDWLLVVVLGDCRGMPAEGSVAARAGFTAVLLLAPLANEALAVERRVAIVLIAV